MKERELYKLVNEVLDTHGDLVDKIHIIDNSEFDKKEFRIYHGDGYCWDVTVETMVETMVEDEVEIFENEGSFTEENGDCVFYGFSEEWDGFKQSGIDKAIELFSEYAQIK